jgi:hypothetical protein
VWPSLEDISSCFIAYPGPPFADERWGPLAAGEQITTLGRARFRLSSPLLTSHVQARIAGRVLHGYLLRSSLLTAWMGFSGLEDEFHFRLYYYRLP